MIFGRDPFGASVFGGTAESFGAPSPFSILLQQPNASDRVLLAEVTLFDPIADQEVTIRVGNGESFSTAQFAPALASEITFRQSLFSDPDGPGEGGGSVSIGDVRISNPRRRPGQAGPFDALRSYDPDGRIVRFLMGRESFTLEQYGEILRAYIEDLTWNESEIRLILRDPAVLLDLAVQRNLYTGGTEFIGGGGTDNKNRPIPLCYGEPSLIEPVLINSGFDLYQIHESSVEAQERVYDGLAPFTYDGNFSSIVGAIAWAPVKGHYVSVNVLGMFRLGNKPAHRVLCSPKGDNGGPEGYVSSLGSIIRRMLTKDPDWTDAMLELPTFGTVNALYPGPFAVYTGTSSFTRRDLIARQLLDPLYGGLSFTRNGLLSLGILRDVPPSRAIVGDDVITISRRKTRPPYWQHRIGYGRAFTPLTASEIAGAATAELSAFALEPYRYAMVQDTDTLDRRKLSKPREPQTALVLESQAQQEALRSQSLTGVDADGYDLVVKNHQFLLQAGQRVLLSYPRWGLDTGRPFWIVDLEERTRLRQTHLKLWGARG